MNLSVRDAVGRIPRGFLGMLALVAVCEAFIADNDLKFSRMDAHDWKTTARAARSVSPMGGILCFGDSQLKNGLLPLVMEARAGEPVDCLAVEAGQAPTSYFLLRKALEAGAHPSAIVVNWEPNLLKDGVDRNIRLWPELLDVREGLDLAWTSGSVRTLTAAALGAALPSYRARAEIRENLRAALNGETPSMGLVIELFWRNRLLNRGAVALAKDQAGRSADLSRWGDAQPRPWEADPVQSAYARKFLKLAQAREIPVYVVLMPVSPGMQAKYEANKIDAPYAAWVRKLAGRFPNAVVVDLRHSGYPESVFHDALHLDRDGATAASIAFGEVLRRQIDGQTTGNRWVALPPYRTSESGVAFEDTTRTYQFITTRADRTRR